MAWPVDCFNAIKSKVKDRAVSSYQSSFSRSRVASRTCTHNITEEQDKTNKVTPCTAISLHDELLNSVNDTLVHARREGNAERDS